MKTLQERRLILKELQIELRKQKNEIKELQRKKTFSWKSEYELKNKKAFIRGFGILHTIIKRRPDLEITKDNINLIINIELISSLKIETKWKEFNQSLYGIDFKKIYETISN